MSVVVDPLHDVESYSTVHQLVSTIKGVLESSTTSLGCVRAAFPPGSMTGAPKLRSVELLETLERGSNGRRGIYSGIFGFLSLKSDKERHHSSDWSVIIRTAVIEQRNDTEKCMISVGAGGAITVMSDATSEWREMICKAKSVLSAIIK